MRSPARSGAPGFTIAEAFEPIVLIATLALIRVLVIEAEAKSNGWRDAAQAANWVISAIFAAEFGFILVVAPRKAAALRAHWATRQTWQHLGSRAVRSSFPLGG